jgi:hypothetical protein
MINGSNKGPVRIKVTMRATCECGWTGNYTSELEYLTIQIAEHAFGHAAEVTNE